MNKKLLSMVAAFGLLVPALTFSVGAQDTDIVTPAGEFPIVTEPITIKILIATGEAISDFNDNAYTKWLEEKTGLNLEIEMVAAANLVYFDGHFPKAPILPGVVQVDWALKYGRENFALPAKFKALHSLKFHNVIQPNATFYLALVYDSVKKSLNFRYFSGNLEHSSGRILFTES